MLITEKEYRVCKAASALVCLIVMVMALYLQINLACIASADYIPIEVIEMCWEEKKAEELKALAARKPGTSGRVLIDDFGIDVGLYRNVKGKAQEIVDAQDSAALLRYEKQWMIFDHGTDPWINIQKAIPYETVMEIVKGDRTLQFGCVRNQKGYYLENGNPSTGARELFDADGNIARYENEGGIATICCLSHVEDTGKSDCALIYWQPISSSCGEDWSTFLSQT